MRSRKVDHRIARASSIAAWRARGQTVIRGAESAAISFPEFLIYWIRWRSGKDSFPLHEWILHAHGSKPLSILQVFAIEDVATGLDGSCDDQRVIPGELIAAVQVQRLGEDQWRGMDGQQR